MRHHFKQMRNWNSAGDAAPYSVHVPPVNDMIGRRLRRHYEELEDQPLPDRFSALLEALDSGDRRERRN